MAVGAPRDDACQSTSTNQNFGRSPPLHRRAPNVARVAGNGLPQRMSRALPECSAVACPTPSRTLSPTMQNDERQVSWRAYLDLDFRVTKKRRSNKVLDTLKKEYRRTSTAHRGQHKTQRGVGVIVVVDIANFLRSSNTFHQSRELPPVAQTVDFESH